MEKYEQLCTEVNTDII